MILVNDIKCNKGESRTAFEAKVAAISAKLKINPNWLMVVMHNESGIDAQRVNFQKGDNPDPFIRAAKRATGLIQFMPSTAIWLGTTNQALYRMTNLQQLDYVYKYFSGYAGKIKSYFDLYFVTFFPVAVGKPDGFVIEAKKISAAAVAKENPAFDINKDKKVTVGEAKKIMAKAIPAAFLDEVITQAEKKSFGLAC